MSIGEGAVGEYALGELPSGEDAAVGGATPIVKKKVHRKKPTQRVELNRNHPCAKGLEQLIVFPEARGLAHSENVKSFDGDYSFENTIHGRAWYSDKTGTVTGITLPKPFNQNATNFALTMVFMVKDSGGTSDSTMYQYHNGTGTGRAVLTLDDAIENNKTLNTFIGGSTVAGSIPVTFNELHVASFIKRGTSIKIMLDGVIDLDATITANAADGDLLIARHKTAAGSNWNGWVYAHAAHSDVPSDDSFAALHKNFWGLLKPKTIYIPSSAPVVAGAELVSSLTGSATLANDLTTDITLNAALTGSATLANDLSTEIRLLTALTGSATLANDLTTDIPLNTALTGSATLANDLTTGIPLDTSLSGSATLVNDLTVSAAAALVTALTGSATLSNALTTDIRLLTALAGSATLTNDLTTGVPLNTALTGSATLANDLTTDIPLDTSLSGSATLVNALTNGIPFNTALTGVATISGVLVSNIPPSVPGLEWTLPVNRLHYSVEGQLHYDLPVNRLHYTLRD